MSAISSYASETPATGDKLLGTDVTDGGTHNFTVDALKTFVSAAPTFTGAVDLGTGGVTVGNADLAINTTALSVDGSASKVAIGLGTGAGDGTLHVHTATAGSVTASTNANDIVIENSGDGGISILTPNTGIARIMFGDPDDNDVGIMSYSHVDDKYRVAAGGANTIIVESGKMGIGQESPDGTLHVHTASAGTVTAAVVADDLVIENSTSCGLSILTANTQLGTIYFGDPEQAGAGRLVYDHPTDVLDLYVNNTKTITLSDATLYPSVTDVTDLGASGADWDNAYINNVTQTSDERKKENIEDLTNAVDFVNALRPVKFNYRDTVIPEVPAVTYEAGEVIVAAKSAVIDEDGNEIEPAVEEVIATGGEIKEDAVPERVISHSRPHTGFIAQEVKTAMGADDWAGYAYDEDTDIHMLRPAEFIGYAIAAIKELVARVEALEA